MGNINGKKVLQVVRTVEAGGVEIDDTTTSPTKVWSSQKTNLELSKAHEPGYYITDEAPTSLGGNSYHIAISDILNLQNASFKSGDIVLYINNNIPDSVYKITSSDLSGVTTEKIGTYSQGSQLYHHFIFMECRNSNFGYTCIFDIETPENTQYDTYSKVRTALSTYYNNCNIQAYCIVRNSGSNTTCHTIKYDSGSNRIVANVFTWSDPRYNSSIIQLDTDTYYCTDKVK